MSDDIQVIAYQQAKAFVDQVDRMSAADPEYLRIVATDHCQAALETVAKTHLESRIRGADLEGVVPLPRPSKGPRQPRATRSPQPCTCGCGGMTKGGRFLPGHDARYHAAQKAAGNVHMA